jgi:RNA polymerase-binding transcription factor DksA
MAKPAPKKSAPAKKQAAKAAPAAKKTAAKPEARKDESKAEPGVTKAAAKKTAAKEPAAKAPAPAKRSGASPFDAKFLDGQRELLLEERAKLLGSAERLEGEAASLMEDLDPGDVQFDDESGEGDSLVVERERDLALSAQARQMIADIDAALARIVDGTYGFSVVSGRAIPKDRLRAIPWATELVEEKVGGLGTRR